MAAALRTGPRTVGVSVSKASRHSAFLGHYATFGAPFDTGSKVGGWLAHL